MFNEMCIGHVCPIRSILGPITMERNGKCYQFCGHRMDTFFVRKLPGVDLVYAIRNATYSPVGNHVWLALKHQLTSI